MTPKVGDRVFQMTTTIGTGTYSLSAGPAGFQAFLDDPNISPGDTVAYFVVDSLDTPTQWEIAEGVIAGGAPDTLTRANILDSSNDGAAVSWPAGTKYIVSSASAKRLFLVDTANYQEAVERLTVPSFMRGHLSGLTLSNNVLDATNDIDIAAGVAVDSTNAAFMKLAAGITKGLDAAWAVGSGNGGLDTGTKANGTWYHVWLIRRSDTGVVDALFSTSATSPTMPAGYDQKRRIGAVRTSGIGGILAFTQFDDEFRWTSVPTDVNITTLGTSYTNYTVSVPLGVAVEAVLQGTFTGSTTSAELFISRPGETDAAGVAVARMVSAATLAFGQIRVRTNTSSQVQAKAGAASSSLTLGALGWIDRRGRGD